MRIVIKLNGYFSTAGERFENSHAFTDAENQLNRLRQRAPLMAHHAR
jgi:hypothetical protein